MQKFELKEKFDKELKTILNSTDNILNIQTQSLIITELKKSFITELNKFIQSMIEYLILERWKKPCQYN